MHWASLSPLAGAAAGIFISTLASNLVIGYEPKIIVGPQLIRRGRIAILLATILFACLLGLCGIFYYQSSLLAKASGLQTHGFAILLLALVLIAYAVMLFVLISAQRKASHAIVLQNFPRQEVTATITEVIRKIEPGVIPTRKWLKTSFAFRGGTIVLQFPLHGRVSRIDFFSEHLPAVDSVRQQILTVLTQLNIPSAKRLQFSLNTFVFAGVLVSSLLGVYLRWEPWIIQERFNGHREFLFSLRFSTDGKSFVTSSQDQTARVWSMESGQSLAILAGHTDGVHDARFSPDGQHILTVSGDGSAIIWDLKPGTPKFVLKGHKVGILSALFSPNGKHALTTGKDGTVCIWNAEDGSLIRKSNAGGNGWVQACYALEGTTILTLGSDQVLRRWEANTGSSQGTLASNAGYFSVSPGGKSVYVLGMDLRARIQDVSTGAEQVTIGSALNAKATFSPDGRLLVIHSRNTPTNIYEVESGKCLATLTSEERSSHAVAFSPDSQRLLTGSIGSAEIWDVKTGQQIARLKDPNIAGNVASFLPDNARVILDDQMGACTIWHQQRADSGWGAAGLPEFWITLFCATGLIWSIWRDRRSKGNR